MLLALLAAAFAGCVTDVDGVQQGGDGAPTSGARPGTGSVPENAPPQASGGAAAAPGDGSASSPASDDAAAPAPTSVEGTFRFEHDGLVQEATFRANGTFTYTQRADTGESGTWEGTYDLQKGTSRMNDHTDSFRLHHADLVSLQDLLLRRVLPDGSLAPPRASERLVGEFTSQVDDKVEDVTFRADGTWHMVGSLKTSTSIGTWQNAGRYDVVSGAMRWDEGTHAGKTAALKRWTEQVVLIDGVPYVQGER